MSLDTRYRPRTYDDVLGQEGTTKILRQFVSTRSGLHQSYVFAGAYGSGKTTLARILARALLCAQPVDGAPCDACPSCVSFLRGTSSDFYEIDAATNSGKDSIKQITSDLQYDTFSGRHKVHLMDEAHRLSTDAFDALLKPLEDNIPGTQDKQLVCIFCTTEPERMRATILSRCAPAFIIRPCPPEVIATRLAQICDREGIPYDLRALTLIAELTECHIRDALKAIEGVSMLGSITVETVSRYLHLDHSITVLDILSSLRDNLPLALGRTEVLLKVMSPITVYERLAEMAMLAYRTTLGVAQVPGYLPADRVASLGTALGDDLLTYADRFSTRPSRPTASMVLCDLAQLHRGPVATTILAPVAAVVKKSQEPPKSLGKVEDKAQIVDGVHVHPRAVNNKTDPVTHNVPTPPALSTELPPKEFFRLVRMRATELRVNGPEGRDNMGDPGADQSRGTEGD